MKSLVHWILFEVHHHLALLVDDFHVIGAVREIGSVFVITLLTPLHCLCHVLLLDLYFDFYVLPYHPHSFFAIAVFFFQNPFFHCPSL
jgi:hypothetical protein